MQAQLGNEQSNSKSGKERRDFGSLISVGMVSIVVMVLMALAISDTPTSPEERFPIESASISGEVSEIVYVGTSPSLNIRFSDGRHITFNSISKAYVIQEGACQMFHYDKYFARAIPQVNQKRELRYNQITNVSDC